MNRCQICNLLEGQFNVTLNDKNICNYCEHLENNRDEILDYTGREKLLEQRLEKLKGKYRYDAVVGISGGKDSTYVLLQMVKKYDLNVAAVTFDNGFLTDFARESIDNTIKQLGVDHYYYKPNWDIHRKFYTAAVKKMGNPCIACALAGYFLAIKECYANEIPFFVHGRTPYQMYRNYYSSNNDVFLSIMKLNLEEHSFLALSKLYGMLNGYVKYFVSGIADNLEEGKAITDEFFVDSALLTEEFVPEFLAYFLFEEYDEEKNKRQIQEALNWSRPSADNMMGHYDCAIHDAAGYMYKELNDSNILERDAAVMTRFGAISKERAQELIRLNEPTPGNLEKSLDALCSLCEMSRADLDANLTAIKQSGVNRFESVL
jgi:hypothetical protein